MLVGDDGAGSRFRRLNTAIPDAAALRAAVSLYCSDPATANNSYGYIGDWDVSRVDDMSFLFSSFDASLTTNAGYCGANASSLNPDLSAWDTSSVTNTESIFRGATAFNGELAAWDLSSCTTMKGAFNGASAFNGDDLSAWDVGKVKNIVGVFYQAALFNGDVSTWDVSGVTSTAYAMYNALAFNRDVSAWDTRKILTTQYMFAAFQTGDSFNQDISAWDLASCTSTFKMFQSLDAFQQVLCWNLTGIATTTDMFVATSGSADPSAAKCRCTTAGTYYNGSACLPCPADTYSAGGMTMGCLSCASGRFAAVGR